ncbi:MAG: hypothetical protein ACLFVT_07655 [Syntrophobacteria bacterium]
MIGFMKEKPEGVSLVSRYGVAVGRLALGLLLCFAPACGTQPPEEKAVEVKFRDVTLDRAAVSKMLALVAPSHSPDEERVSPAYRFLFTYLAETPAADLVTTAGHGDATWRMEKIFILDNCVAVQMSEGHYLETLFFTRYGEGWRLAARIRPEHHQ